MCAYTLDLRPVLFCSPNMSSVANNNEMRRQLTQYTPGSIRNIQNHPFGRVCLQLFGMAGHGKSSLINSCLCVMTDKAYFNFAVSGSAPEPITMNRKPFSIQDSVYIVDNRGMYKLEDEEVMEMAAQFCQLRPQGQVFWNRRIERTTEQVFKMFNSTNPEVLVPVFVYSAECSYTTQRKGEIYPFIKAAKDVTGFFPIVVITNCRMHQSKELITKFKEFGANYVFAIENYTTTSSERNDVTDGKILNFLHACLKEADRRIEIRKERNLQEEFLGQLMDLFQRELDLKDKIIKRLTEDQNKRKMESGSTCVIS